MWKGNVLNKSEKGRALPAVHSNRRRLNCQPTGQDTAGLACCERERERDITENQSTVLRSFFFWRKQYYPSFVFATTVGLWPLTLARCLPQPPPPPCQTRTHRWPLHCRPLGNANCDSFSHASESEGACAAPAHTESWLQDMDMSCKKFVTCWLMLWAPRCTSN